MPRPRRRGGRSRQTVLAVVLLLALGAPAAIAETGPEVRIVPSTGLLDAPLRLEASGLLPSLRIGLVLSTRDAEGRRWRARTRLRTNGDGEARLDAARLLPRLLPVDHPRSTPLVDSLAPPARELELSVDLLVEGRTVARADARRLLIDRAVRTRLLTIGSDGLVGRYATMKREGRRPAVLVLGGSEGGLRPSIAATLLASHGFPTLRLAYFRAPGLPPELRRIPLEYFEKALRWVARQPGVDARRLFVLGSSRGGELALILGSRFRKLVYGVAAYTPSSYVVSALDGFSPAWTHRGKPLRHVTVRGGWPAPRSPEGRAAAIPVERIPGPVLLVGGDDDLVWPSGDYVHAIARRLREQGKRTFSSLVFGDAGHAVGAVFPSLPLATFGWVSPPGGFPEADANARTRAWTVLLRMLERAAR